MSFIKNIKGRLSFEHIFRADASQGGEPAFSATILIPKNDPQITMLQEVLSAVAKEKWKEKAPKMLQGLVTTGKTCLRDGDTTTYENYEGMMYVTARNKNRPSAYDRKANPVEEADGLIYSGCYVIARIEFWAQDNQFGKRINGKLLGVQFVKDGDRFGAGSGPAKATDFEVLDDDDEDGNNPWD